MFISNIVEISLSDFAFYFNEVKEKRKISDTINLNKKKHVKKDDDILIYTFDEYR